jgi:hypothetical protein
VAWWRREAAARARGRADGDPIRLPHRIHTCVLAVFPWIGLDTASTTHEPHVTLSVDGWMDG